MPHQDRRQEQKKDSEGEGPQHPTGKKPRQVTAVVRQVSVSGFPKQANKALLDSISKKKS